MKKEPKVSIIVQNWNGEDHIKDCLDSVFSQDYKNIEVIAVDSGSKDHSIEIINRYKKVKLIALEKDCGAPYANNLGVKTATGKYVMLLNNDTILLNDTIRKLVEAVGDSNFVVSPVQLDWNNRIEGFGCPHYWAGTTLNKLTNSKGDSPFYLSIACCLLLKKLYEKYQLNEHFWFYEETEWAWRLHLKNIPQFIVNDAYYKHKVGGSMNPGKTAFYVAKSSTATHFICLKSHTLVLLLPLILYHHFRLIAAETIRLKKPLVIRKFLSGILSFMSDINLYFEDRHNVQKTRMFGDIYIIKKMSASSGYVRHMENTYRNTNVKN